MAYKALLVGINKYPGCPLNGCINDITDMANFLTTKCNFPQDAVRLLADERATTAAILDRLNWLISGAQPGDHLLFHYSGHGAQVATRSKVGEIDGLDEVICPVEFDWTDAHMIRDKQFFQLFKSVPKGVHFIWISDSCHSDDLEKDMVRVRSMPMPIDMAWRMTTAKNKDLEAKKDVTVLDNVLLLSGCKSNQTSADAVFNGRANGALTYYLLHELQEKNGTTSSMTTILSKVRADLRSNRYSQIPQLEGPKDMQMITFA